MRTPIYFLLLITFPIFCFGQEKIKDSLDSNIYTDDLIFDLADITFKTLSERIEKFAINEDFFQNAFE